MAVFNAFRAFLLVTLLTCAIVIQAESTSDATDASNALRYVQSNPWTMHDPDFPVHVSVATFADAVWTADHQDDNNKPMLHIPSSVINISVVLPTTLTNVTDAKVTITLFKMETNERFQVMADTQVQYSRSYRMDVGTHAQQMVLRVYVKAKASSNGEYADTTRRALWVRTLDLSPSEPQYMVCSDTNDAKKADVHISKRPRTNMPMDLCAGYTLNGTIPVRKWYFDDQSDADKTYQARSFEFIERLIAKAKSKQTYYYGETDAYLFDALAKYPITNQHVLIIGSTTPWYESICIAQGAASCTTIDYNRLRYDHPKIQTYTVAEFEYGIANGDIRARFDAIFSISSVEHDGLGRYGDPLDPEADLKAMKQLLQYVNNDATAQETRLFLGIPVGPDAVVWNAQRIYGPIRLPLLLQPWELMESFGFDKDHDFTAPFRLDHQPIFVLQQAPQVHRERTTEHTEL